MSTDKKKQQQLGGGVLGEWTLRRRFLQCVPQIVFGPHRLVLCGWCRTVLGAVAWRSVTVNSVDY